MSQFSRGDHVRHSMSGWAGEVMEVYDHDGGQGQGPLVTVRPTWPRPKEYAGVRPVGDEWQGWAPITVTADELELVKSDG